MKTPQKNAGAPFSGTQENKPAGMCIFTGMHRPLPSAQHTALDTSALDRLLHASMSRFSGLSPAALATVWFDWVAHLSIAPGKQIELAQSAMEKAAHLVAYASRGMITSEQFECCVTPLPQDRRFEDAGWQNWPYNLYQQSFLLTEQWWQQATSTVRGVTRHHADVLPFLTRQWLDAFSPLNFPLTNPRVVKASTEQGGMNFIRGAQNCYEDVVRLLNQSPPVGAEDYTIGENIAVTQGKVVFQNRLIELIQYAPATTTVYAEPILIVPAWIMKYYILDLSPENSLVKYLVSQGHTVFMISWKNPDMGDRDLGFEDYLNLGVMEAIKAVTTIVPEQKIHAAGYCLGGTLLSIATAAMARDLDTRLASITLFASQVDFEEAGELLLFIDESQLAFVEDVMWEQGYLNKHQMAEAFQMLRSYDLVWSRIVEQYLLGNRQPINDLMAWNADATRMPYRMHSEYLRRLFLNNDLAEGHFTAGGRPISLSDIRLPTFAVGTQRDHIAPWKSAYKIHLFTDADVTFVLASGGHNAGIVSEPGHAHRSYQIASRKSTDNYLVPEEWQARTPIQQGSWWPEWQRWLANHSSTQVSPPSVGAAKQGYPALRDAPGDYVLMP